MYFDGLSDGFDLFLDIKKMKTYTDDEIVVKRYFMNKKPPKQTKTTKANRINAKPILNMNEREQV